MIGPQSRFYFSCGIACCYFDGVTAEAHYQRRLGHSSCGNGVISISTEHIPLPVPRSCPRIRFGQARTTHVPYRSRLRQRAACYRDRHSRDSSVGLPCGLVVVSARVALTAWWFNALQTRTECRQAVERSTVRWTHAVTLRKWHVAACYILKQLLSSVQVFENLALRLGIKRRAVDRFRKPATSHILRVLSQHALFLASMRHSGGGPSVLGPLDLRDAFHGPAFKRQQDCIGRQHGYPLHHEACK